MRTHIRLVPVHRLTIARHVSFYPHSHRTLIPLSSHGASAWAVVPGYSHITFFPYLFFQADPHVSLSRPPLASLSPAVASASPRSRPPLASLSPRSRPRHGASAGCSGAVAPLPPGDGSTARRSRLARLSPHYRPTAGGIARPLACVGTSLRAFHR